MLLSVQRLWMLPTVTFVEGSLVSTAHNNTFQGSKAFKLLKAPSSHESHHKTTVKPKNTIVHVGKDEPRATRSKTRESATAERQPEPLPQPSAKRNEEPVPCTGPSSSTPSWLERNYEIPTRMGPYSLSRYAHNNPVAVLKDPKLATGQRLMTLRTCVRCPTSEAQGEDHNTRPRTRRVEYNRSKALFLSTDTSLPPPPPNLSPSYKIIACPKHPAR